MGLCDRKILVLIPAFNEASHLHEVLEELRQTLPASQAVVIDDGSVDETACVARSLGAHVLRHPFNLGYGAALQTGYKFALANKVRHVAQMDADGQHEASQIGRLVEPVIRGELDLAIGTRFRSPERYQAGVVQQAGLSLLRAFARAYEIHLTDPMSGFQAMNHKVLELYAQDFFPHDYPDLEILIQAVRHGLKIGERPTRMRQSLRSSRLHSGLSPLYYLYRALLSLLVVSPSGPRRPPVFHPGQEVVEPR